MVAIITFTLDCLDAEALSRFWLAALGYSSVQRAEPAGLHWVVRPADDREPLIVLQQVADPKQGKNRMHLDLHVEDLGAEVMRLQTLGAGRLTEDRIGGQGYASCVMADPEGNEFCVVQRRASP